MVTCINVRLQSGDISFSWLWLLLDVSAVSVVIVICDMHRQEFSLYEHVYSLGHVSLYPKGET